MDLLDQMETFVHVVEAGSLSKAARARSLSLPAVSRQLRALEHDLGRALIIRSTRRLRVTEAGQRWYENCARILSDLEQARREVGSTAAVRGLLTVSAPVTFGQVHVMPCIHTLLARHQDLSINVRLEDQLVDLVSDAVDVVVRGGFELPDSPSLISRPLRRFHRLAVATPAYLRRHGSPADPRALREHSCLIQLGAFGPLHDWRFTRGSEARSIQVSGRLRATSPMALLAATLAGDGIALLPDWLVDQEIEARRLKRVLADWTTPMTSVWAVYRSESRAAPRIKAFVDAMTVNDRGEVS
jgi:DNA-binding transcriptional LysR family regulator